MVFSSLASDRFANLVIIINRKARYILLKVAQTTLSCIFAQLIEDNFGIPKFYVLRRGIRIYNFSSDIHFYTSPQHNNWPPLLLFLLCKFRITVVWSRIKRPYTEFGLGKYPDMGRFYYINLL